MKIIILILLGCLIMNPNISAENLEDNYLTETSFPIVKNN
jgi:hypothetical protein